MESQRAKKPAGKRKTEWGVGSGRLRVTGEPGAEWSVTLPSDHSVDSLAGWALWQSGFKYQSVRIWISPSNLPPIHSAAGVGVGGSV